jgi:hypothetical protein
MDAKNAAGDLEYIRSVMERSRRRIDPHAFHFVHWGAIVAVWYPAANLLLHRGEKGAAIAVGVASLLLGMLLSGIREARLARRPRLPGEDELVGEQVLKVVWGSLGAALLVSVFGPATGFLRGETVPVVWGLAYANLAFMTGVVYSRESLWSGGFILAGCLLAMAFEEWNGVILGPVMGLGLIVPGLMAERRVREMARETAAEEPGEALGG